MEDLISRYDAINALETIGYDFSESDLSEPELAEVCEAIGDVRHDMMQRLKRLPPTYPNIIYCKDCKHFIREDREEYTPYGFYNTYFDAFCDKHWDNEQGEYINVKLDDFCSFAERKEESNTNEYINQRYGICLDGIEEEIRCAICENPMHTYKGCNGDCKYNEDIFKRITEALDRRIDLLPYAPPKSYEIRYNDCANAMLKMWMDNVLTDGEYYRIMDKLNAHKKGETE